MLARQINASASESAWVGAVIGSFSQAVPATNLHRDLRGDLPQRAAKISSRTRRRGDPLCLL